MLDTPQGAPIGPQATLSSQPIDRLAGTTELVLDWVGRMVSARNPLVERLTFFWHRHWACSLDSVDLLFMARQNDLFRRYADLGANPTADFRNLAYEVSEDPAMLRYLSGESNRRGQPNENYARELMELFCLGVTDTAGNPNYTETDVRELARALSGWTINTTDPNNPRGVFNSSRFDNLSKTFLGSTGNFGSRQAVDIVLARPQHASHIVRKLWSEFIAGPPDAATLADLTSHLHGQRAPDQAASAEDPHASAALRLALRADADQASDRLPGRRLPPGRSQRHQHRSRTRGWRRWGRCRSSRPTSRAGSTAPRS